MCGRYVLFTDEEEDDITDLVNEIQQRLRENGEDDETGGFRADGEIFPSQRVPVLTKERPEAMRWGLPGFKGKGLIINARTESVYGKALFRPSITERRIIVPSHGFYEWRKTAGGKDKEKLLFNLPDVRTLYLAGLYNEYDDGPRFAIVTTSANDSMSPVHNRMPVIVLPSEIEGYLNNGRIACKILGRVPPELGFVAA